MILNKEKAALLKKIAPNNKKIASYEAKIKKNEELTEALVTAEKYGQLENKKFINAILDKVLKKDDEQ